MGGSQKNMYNAHNEKRIKNDKNVKKHNADEGFTKKFVKSSHSVYKNVPKNWNCGC
jgi:hypothetical protein